MIRSDMSTTLKNLFLVACAGM